MVIVASDAASGFAELFEELVTAWLPLLIEMGGLIQRFVEEYPVSSGKHFWQLRARFRAEHRG